MLLDRKKIREVLFGLVGFYNPSNPNYPNLIPSLLESSSGRKVNEVHGLLNDLENIDQSIKNFSHYNYPEYSPTADANGEYTNGSKVSFSGTNYEYILNTPSDGTPPPDSRWREIDEMSDYLLKQVYLGIDKMTDDWINEKKLRERIKSIYDKVLLFSGVPNYRDTVENRDNFVGLRLRLKRGQNSLITILNRIGTHFNSSFNGLTIYVYHTSQQNPIYTYNLDYTQAKSSQWLTLAEDNILRYNSDNGAGGDFYIGYKQSDLEALGAKALKMNINWRAYPCADCGGNWGDYYKQYSPFVDVVGFEIREEEFGAGDTLFDPDEVGISLTNNYGLNLDFSTKCDISVVIEQEKQLFAEALNNCIGLKLLEAMAFSTRGGNQLAEQVKAEAKKELYHHQGNHGTVYDKYRDSIKALSFDLSGMSEHCFPCQNEDVIIGTATLY